jgi:microtubule-associated protein, RP/EB family
MHSDTFGTMDGTYFVSRGELIQWLNTNFKTNISRIEELASGAVYCKIFDKCMPGKLQMSKVNWNAKHDYEFISNFKVLQQGFLKSGVKKNIEIEKLVKGKCQDNLEMLQWMKKFFDSNHTGPSLVKDKLNNLDYIKRIPTPTPKSRILSERNSIEKPKTRDRSLIDKIKPIDKIFFESKHNDISQTTKSVENPLTEKSKNLDAKSIDSRQIAMDTLQKERDFYFEKLREIELQVQEFPDKENSLVKKIQGILYSDEV